MVVTSYLSKGAITPDWFERQSRRHRDIAFDTILEIRTEEKKQKEEEYRSYEQNMRSAQGKFKT